MKKLSSEDQARLVLLRSAKAEIESTDKLSDELRSKMFGADPNFRKRWEFLEKVTKEKLGEILARGGVPLSTVKRFMGDPTCVLLATTDFAIRMLKYKIESNEYFVQSAADFAVDLEAILQDEHLDRLLRAEAAADRSLSRAMDRLERLQRDRKAEPVPLR